MLNWFFENLLWVGVITIGSIVIAIFNSFWVAGFLIKQNRYTKGNGWGTHLADRYIDLWRFKKGLNTYNGNFYCNPFNIPSRWWLGVIDKKLEEKKLVNIKDEKVYPIVNIRNRFIIKILKFSLIHITGDNRNEYKDI